MIRRAASLLTLSAALAAPARADEGAAATVAAAPIVVTGRTGDYGAVETEAATRTPTRLRDVPQTVSVISRALIDDAGLQSIADVLRFVPGAQVGQGEGHRDQVTLRGNNSTADFFVDGLRDDVQYYRGLYNVDRVEVLKGPNAMTFGRGGGGGVINRVLKRPVAGDGFVRGVAGSDSFGAYEVSSDLNGTLGGGVAFRFNAVAERFDNHRDFYSGRRRAANPTLLIQPGDATRIDLGFEYSDDERVVDRGVPSLAGRPLPGNRRTFFGDPERNRGDFDARVLSAQVSHRFSDAVRVTTRLLGGDYDKAYRNVFAATAVDAAGRVGLEAYRDETERRNLFSQTDLVVGARTGPLRHQLLAGVEYGRQETGNARINGFFDGTATATSGGRRATVDVARRLAVPAATFREGTGFRTVESDAEVLSFYLQDQLSVGSRVDLIAGLRHDRFQLRVDTTSTGASAARTDNLWSPRLGLVVRPAWTLSLYASYARSFLPQSGDQFLSLDAAAAALAPERFENLELGAKWDVADDLLFTAAAYRLDRTNSRAPGATPGSVVLTGEQRSRGLELGLTGRLTKGWRVDAGYALQDAEIQETTAAAPAGRRVPLVPRHQASLWTRADVGGGFGLGLGLQRRSRSFASVSNAVVLPAFTRVDAAAFYRLTQGVEAQLNVENLLNARYFPTAHNDNNITPGAPTAVRATLRLGF